MNKKFFLILTMMGLSALLVACDAFTVSQPTPVVYESFQDSSPGLIISEGEIVPQNDLQIVSHTNGRVQEILVEEGQMVAAGQAIIKLEVPEQLLAELKSAELDQLKSQKALDDLNLYGNLQKQKAYQRVLDAQSARRAALKAWDEFDEDQYEEDLEAIKEDIIDAKKELEDAKENLKDFLDLEEDNPQRVNRQENVDDAQIALNELEREQAALEQTYEQLQVNLAFSEAEDDTAWNEYKKYNQEDVPDDQLALATEQLASANARIIALQASISDLEITAPFDGTLVKLDIQIGQWVYAGQMLAIIADFSSWFVESTDINESEISNIKVGDLVTLAFDAFPDKTMRGKVIEIKDFPVMKYNDVIYPVRIELLDNDLPLRWKMSVIITIER